MVTAEDMDAYACQVALDGNRVITEFIGPDDDLSKEGVVLDMEWRACAQLGLRLIAAAERAAWRDGIEGPEGRTLLRAMLDQVLAEVDHAHDPISWLRAP